MVTPFTRATSVVIVLVLALALAGCSASVDSSSPAVAPELPEVWRSPVWVANLGGEGTSPLADPVVLSRLDSAESSDLDAESYSAVRDTIAAWIAAEVTGVGRDRFTGYWPDGSGTVDGAVDRSRVQVCASLDVLAINPQRLPVFDGGDWVKSLVVWQGNCPHLDVERQLTWVYLKQSGDGWSVVRPALIPRPAPAESGGAPAVPSWAVTVLESCALDNVQVRLEVADAWRTLCEDASRDEVPLVALEGLRSFDDQAQRWRDAVERWGEVEAARRIAFGDGQRCDSAHCAGIAVDVDVSDPAVSLWLTQTVACSDLSGGLVTPSAGLCPASTRPVPRSSLYGFTSPLSTSPGHLEWVLPLESLETGTSAGSCPVDASLPVVELVGEVWRCELTVAGVAPEQVEAAARFAVELARCESGLDPGWFAFAGRFADQPHPDTGRRYDAAGLFALPRNWVTALVGRSANWFDPVDAAQASARRWAEERHFGRDGWSVFGCVTGDGVKEPVLSPPQAVT